MEHGDFRILGLAASLRRASFHRGIVRAAHEVAPEWMSCEGFDLARIIGPTTRRKAAYSLTGIRGRGDVLS